MSQPLTSHPQPYRSAAIDQLAQRVRNGEALIPANEPAPPLSERQSRAALRRLHHVRPHPILQGIVAVALMAGLFAMAWGAADLVLIELSRFGGAR